LANERAVVAEVGPILPVNGVSTVPISASQGKKEIGGGEDEARRWVQINAIEKGGKPHAYGTDERKSGTKFEDGKTQKTDPHRGESLR